MPEPESLRVAAAAYEFERCTSLDALGRRIGDWVGRGARTGARLLVLPEYGAMEAADAVGAVTGLDLAASLRAVAEAMPALDAIHATLARRHRLHILAASGPRLRGDGRFVNGARLFAPDGSSGLAEKSIMTPFEVDWGIAPGSGGVVFETALGRIGVAICYDSEFPLLVRAQCEAGADVVLIPTCTERESGYHRVRSAALARALEGQVATVLAPTTGETPWLLACDHNTGAAGIYAPAEAALAPTGVVAEGRLDDPGWVVGDIDLAGLKRVRTAGEMRNRTDWQHQPGAASLAAAVRIVRVGL